MEKGKILNIIVLVLLLVLIIAVSVIGFFTYRLIFPKVEEEFVIVYEELEPINKITVNLQNPITSNLKKSEEGMDYFAIVEMSYEIVNLKEVEKEAAELVVLLKEFEVVITRIATSEIRKRTYEDALSNEIYDELANDILLQMREEFDTNLISNVIVYKVIAG